MTPLDESISKLRKLLTEVEGIATIEQQDLAMDILNEIEFHTIAELLFKSTP